MYKYHLRNLIPKKNGTDYLPKKKKLNSEVHSSFLVPSIAWNVESTECESQLIVKQYYPATFGATSEFRV